MSLNTLIRTPFLAATVGAWLVAAMVSGCGGDSSAQLGQVDIIGGPNLSDVDAPDAAAGDVTVPPDIQGVDTNEADVDPADVSPSDVDPTDVSPSDVNPADVSPSDVNPADVSPSDVNPADVNPPDVNPIDVGPEQECGNSIREGTEACDDGNEDETDGCLNSCQNAFCGDGKVRLNVEDCDTALPAGQPGACPITCTSNNPCTPSVMLGSDCSARCAISPIGRCGPADGCCLPQCNANGDADCAPQCGNGVIEAGETCDSNCPTACTDDDPCTTNTLVGNPNLCTSACVTGSVSDCGPSDSCCPNTCNSINDGDCSVRCGNGVVETGETCDPPGSCNTQCGDNDACTIHTATGSAANCNFSCSFVTIASCAGNDACCPSVCNATNDSDCSPVCGNNIREGGEGCDGTDTPAGFMCSTDCVATRLPTVFRLNDLDLRDPHVYVDFGWLGCGDMTDNGAPFGLAPSVNAQLQRSITTDTDDPPDGFLNVSLVTIFNPLNIGVVTAQPFGFLEGLCTSPMSTTTCTSGGRTPTWTTYTVSPATPASDTARACLGPRANTTGGYTPAVTTVTATTQQSCYVTAAGAFAIDVAGVTVPLQFAQIAGRFSGNPPVAVDDGMIMGFVSQAVADTILLPDSIPLIGGKPFSSVLPGGKDNCARHSDLDKGPDGTTPGWWFYFRYVSKQVPYTP